MKVDLSSITDAILDGTSYIDYDQGSSDGVLVVDADGIAELNAWYEELAVEAQRVVMILDQQRTVERTVCDCSGGECAS